MSNTRNRSGAGKTDTQKANAREGVELSREEKAHNNNARPKRMSLHAARQLDARPLEGYTQRWFSDRNGRIERVKAAWWEHVTDEHGNPIFRHSGPDKLYLMRLPKEYWEEDQELKKKKVISTMWENTEHLEPGEYRPDDRKQVVTGQLSNEQPEEYTDPLGG